MPYQPCHRGNVNKFFIFYFGIFLCLITFSHPKPFDNGKNCVSEICDTESKNEDDDNEDILVPIVKIYSPSEDENITNIVVVTWEVLYFDISDGYVEIEVDGEVIETPLPVEPVSGNFLEPELVLDRS